VSEHNSQANLRLAQADENRIVPPLAGSDGTEMALWAEMLSMVGRKNGRLYEILIHDAKPQRPVSRPFGRSILKDLERERARIARELHAGAGQPLAGIKLNLEMLDDCAAILPQSGREALARMQTLTEQALEQIRAVSHSLHPPDWQGLTTEESLRYLLQSSGLQDRLEVTTDIPQLPLQPCHVVKIAIYRCAQEAISNVTRHSGATRLSLALRADGDTIELLVQDNGRGFSGAPSGARGIGLFAIREHAEALGGICDISGGGGGASIRVRLPFETD
jgi:two-component system sensor kinase